MIHHFGWRISLALLLTLHPIHYPSSHQYLRHHLWVEICLDSGLEIMRVFAAWLWLPFAILLLLVKMDIFVERSCSFLYYSYVLRRLLFWHHVVSILFICSKNEESRSRRCIEAIGAQCDIARITSWTMLACQLPKMFMGTVSIGLFLLLVYQCFCPKHHVFWVPNCWDLAWMRLILDTHDWQWI